MTGTHITLLAFPLALFAATFAAWLRSRGFGPFAALLRRARRPRGAGALLLALFAIGLVHYGATKGTGGGSGESEAGQPDSPRTLPEEPEPAAITNLAFTGIATSSNAVSLSLAWPTNFFSDGATLDIFAKSGEFTNAWEWLCAATVAPSDTNLSLSVPAIPSAAFFQVRDRETCAATMDDSDGDGIPDIYELRNGTNPYVPDAANAPKLTVGPTGGYETLSAALQASEAYSIVSLDAGEHVLGESIIMPDHPVIVTGPDGGYAVLRSAADTAVVKFADGQDTQTLFRNLVVVLEAERNYQSGFWIGGSLPWEGAGASPRFENVRVRAPYPGVWHYGWHCYRYDGGVLSISNCTMNAAGSASAIGVYSYGGPTISIVGCSFVNFPETDGYATCFRDAVNIVTEPATPRPDLSWAGCPLSGSYSTSVDSDGDGLSDYAEVFTHDTDPYLADSDCDGASDSLEISDGTDPKECSDFLRRMTVVSATSDTAADVTNYVAWGLSPSGWETNGLVACASLPATNTLTAFSSSAAYAKAYADLNRNGEYDADADMLLVRPLPPHGAFSTTTFLFGDVDRDGVLDSQERADGTDPYDGMSFRLTATIVVTDSDPGATNCLAWGTGTVTNGTVAFSGVSATVLVDVVTTNGTAFVRCLRRFPSGAEVPYSLSLAKADNGRSVTFSIGDADGDTIFDSMEISHGTDPTDFRSRCFSMSFVERGVFRTANPLTAEVILGTNCVFGPVVVTNKTLAVDIGHVFDGEDASMNLYFWDDANSNGTRDADEVFVRQALPIRGHDNVHTNKLSFGAFDTDNDEILDWWEISRGLSPTNAADAYLDSDGDGLINLHEFWADCNPLAPDGSNTLLSVLARSIDDRISGTGTNSLAMFIDYKSQGINLHTNVYFWGADVDLSSMSVWHSGGWGWSRASVALSPMHILMCHHWQVPIGASLYFVGQDGQLYSRVMSCSQQVLDSTGNATDICIGLLSAPLPAQVSIAKVFPKEIDRKIASGKALPVMQINQFKEGLVNELSGLTTVAHDGCSFVMSQVEGRHAHTGLLIQHDSGSPTFAIMGRTAVLIGSHYNSRYDPSVCAYADQIQATMDALLPGNTNLLQTIDVSGYPDLPNWRIVQ